MQNLEEPKKFYQYKQEAFANKQKEKLNYRKYFLLDGFDPKNLTESRDLISYNAINVTVFKGGSCVCSDFPVDEMKQKLNKSNIEASPYDKFEIEQSTEEYNLLDMNMFKNLDWQLILYT